MESTFKRSPHYTKRGIKVGDIIVTRKGNKALVLGYEACEIYYNVQFLSQFTDESFETLEDLQEYCEENDLAYIEISFHRLPLCA